jgi:hypothetical protein
MHQKKKIAAKIASVNGLKGPILVRFSPSDACERVDALQMFGVHVPSSEHS